MNIRYRDWLRGKIDRIGFGLFLSGTIFRQENWFLVNLFRMFRESGFYLKD